MRTAVHWKTQQHQTMSPTHLFIFCSILISFWQFETGEALRETTDQVECLWNNFVCFKFSGLEKTARNSFGDIVFCNMLPTMCKSTLHRYHKGGGKYNDLTHAGMPVSYFRILN